MYQLSDVYIGNFPLTQGFGSRPEIYQARYGLNGHNGIDFACPAMTPVLSAWEGKVLSIEFDGGGYGKLIKVLHDGYRTLYAHLNDAVVSVGEQVVAGQLIGHSNNSGFSDGNHLHFGVAPCDAQGNKTEPNNGFSGYIDPMSSRCVWHLKNPSAPVVQDHTSQPPIPVPNEDFVRMVSEGTNYKVIRAFCLEHGLNDFLGQSQLSKDVNDPEGGNKVVSYIGHLLTQVTELSNQVPHPIDIDNATPEAKTALLSAILQGIKNFVYVKGGN